MNEKSPIYLFANWKMYLNVQESEDLASNLVKTSKDLPSEVAMVVFPSALAFTAVAKITADTRLALGAQNIHWIDKGGYTGENSAAMYKQVGAAYSLVGHSERRHVFQEGNYETRQKIESLLALGMVPVLCVGETLQERDEGVSTEVVEAQLHSAFSNINWPEGIDLIVAYEPVWAVGTGKSCQPEEAQRMAELIDEFVKELVGPVKPIVLYGGSVRSENIISYIQEPHIQGVLVGGASTKISSWSDILDRVHG